MRIPVANKTQEKRTQVETKVLTCVQKPREVFVMGTLGQAGSRAERLKLKATTREQKRRRCEGL